MVDITTYKAFGDSAVIACENLNSHVFVSSEQELIDLIEKVDQFPLLVSVMPLARGEDESEDNVGESNSALFFVLKPWKNEATQAERMDLWSLTQQGMKEFKEYIAAQMAGGEYLPMLWRSQFDRRTQNPEFNYLGMSGFSLSFNFSTDGF